MSIAGGVSQALDRANKVHSNAVQVFTKNNRQWLGPAIDTADIQRWNTEMPSLGICYAVSHASYLINLAGPKEDLWEKSRHAHQDEIERAHAYGIAHVVLHPGSHMGSGEEIGMSRIAGALNHIHDQPPACVDTVTCLELMAGQGSMLGSSLEQLRTIIDQVEDTRRVGVCLDTCHAFAAGYDLRTVEGYASFMDQVEQILGLARVKVWHFNDSKGKLGSHLDRHTHIGEGEIGTAGFGYILNDPRWDGIAMLLETPKEDNLEEDVINLSRLVALVEDPTRIPPGLHGSQPSS
jgi:deoxyribonuclease-4